MFMATDAYLKRLTHALEFIIAPEIESDAARGQVFAVIDLLNQLMGRIEYKPDLIASDVAANSEMIKRIVQGLEGAAAAVPEEISAFLKEVESVPGPKNLGQRARSEEILCRAIVLLHEHRQKLGAASGQELDRALREHILKVATRDLGLMKPPLLEKISRSKR